MIKAYYSVVVMVLFCSINLFGQTAKDTALDLALGLSIEELMNTKVSIATKSEKTISEAPAIVTVISQEVIKNSGARYLSDILKYIPGFEFSKSRTGPENIGVRGVKDPLTTARFLILKDGIPYNDVMYGASIGLTKAFDLNTIKRIEIVRGPGSALYGRSAFAGVVNIITKSGEEKSELDLRSSVGNFSTMSYGGSYGTKKDDFDAYLAFEKVSSAVTNSQFDDGMGGEKTWSLGIDNLYVNSKVGFKGFEFTGSFSDIINYAATGPFITDSDKSTKIGMYSVDYNKKLLPNLNFSSKIYGRNEKQTQNIEILKPGITAEAAPGVPYKAVYPNGMYVTPDFSSYVYGADFNVGLDINEQHQSLVGIQADLYGVDNVNLYSSYDTYTGAPLTYVDGVDTLFRGKDTQVKDDRGWIEDDGHHYNNLAFYFQHVYSPIKNLSFTVGGRYDLDSEIGGVFNPRLAMVWDTKQKLVFKLLYGQAYRAPNTQEQYRITGFTVGNKNLKPETIKTTEFSVDYNMNKNINNRLTVFYNVLSNMIYAQGVTSGTPGSPYANIGENTSVGFEYEYKMMLSKQFYMFANYSYTMSEDNVLGKDKKETYAHRDIAPHKINLGANYMFLKYFNFNTGLQYRSEREKYFAISKQTGDYILDENGAKVFVSQDKIGDYVLWDAKLRVMNFFNTLELSAEVYNILNTTYYDQDTEYAHQPSREGRQFIFTLEYRF